MGSVGAGENGLWGSSIIGFGVDAAREEKEKRLRKNSKDGPCYCEELRRRTTTTTTKSHSGPASASTPKTKTSAQ